MVDRWHLRWVVLGAVLVAAFGLSPAHAACAEPRVLLHGPSTLSVEDTITVRGEFWTNECNDTTVCGTGCGDRCEGPEPERPLRNITIVMTRPGGLGHNPMCSQKVSMRPPTSPSTARCSSRPKHRQVDIGLGPTLQAAMSPSHHASESWNREMYAAVRDRSHAPWPNRLRASGAVRSWL